MDDAQNETRIAARKLPDAVFLPVDAPEYEAVSERVMATLRSLDVVVEVEVGGPGRGVPGREQVVGVADGERAVARAHERLGGRCVRARGGAVRAGPQPRVVPAAARPVGVAGEAGAARAVVERVPARPDLCGHATDGVEKALRIGVERADGGLDQAEEVLTHPWDAGELRPVGDLVEREPVAELTGWEAEALLQAQDVGAHVVDDVLLVGVLVFDDQEVVLAEHPARHPPEDHAHLGTGDAAGHRGEGVGGDLLIQPIGDGPQQPLERRDVGAHPALAIGDPGPGVARQAPQPGGLRHLLLRDRGELVEVTSQRLVVVRL